MAEEFANTAIQAVGVVLGIVALVVLIHLANDEGYVLPVVSVAVYGGTLVLAFLSSTLYHGTWHVGAKRIFRTVDHCAIYLLIAGTYTPIALLVLRGSLGWALLAAVWLIALTGTVLRIVLPHQLVKLRIGLYLALGWLAVAWAKPLFDGLGPAGVGLLVAGGLAYTIGVVFFRWHGLPYHKAVWHGFVIIGSACHFASIAFYAVPAYAS